MNPVQIVEAARPEVGTMPPVERRHLRERIFDVAMRSRSEHSPIDVATPNTRGANALRLGALGLLGVAAIGGLVYSASRDTPGTRAVTPVDTEATAETTPAPPRATVVPAPRPTIAPTTTMPPTPGSPETPLLLPPERNRLDALTVTRSKLGASALLLRGPDLSTISLTENDGTAPTTTEPEPDDDADDETPPSTTLPPRQFAAVTVREPVEDAPGVYSIVVPCGDATVLDVAGRPPFRPEINQLFDSMQIVDGVIELDLPEGWAAISGGPGTDEFVFGLPVRVGEQDVTITVAQYPAGSLAVAGTDQRQYGPVTFNGQQSWVHRDADDPASFDVLTMVGSTAMRISASDISLAETEAIIAGLTPGDVEEWTQRFGTLPVENDPDIRACADQPEFLIL